MAYNNKTYKRHRGIRTLNHNRYERYILTVKLYAQEFLVGFEPTILESEAQCFIH